MTAVFALPWVQEATGIPWISIAAIMATHAAWILFAYFVVLPRIKASRRAFDLLVIGNLVIGTSLASLIPVLADAPDSVLWGAMILYATLNGSLAELEPSVPFEELAGTFAISSARSGSCGLDAGGRVKPALLVVEDNAQMREALTTVLGERFDVDAVALARTALARSREYAIALVDLGLPDLDGVQLVAALRARSTMPILVLTIEDATERVLAALSAGASGYLLKDRLAIELLSSIDAALDGESPLSPRAARHVVASLHGSQPPPALDLDLTASERRVLEALARGLTYDQIGLMLDISVNTVRSRVRTLYDKLDVASRTEAVVVAAQRGLIQLDS